MLDFSYVFVFVFFFRSSSYEWQTTHTHTTVESRTTLLSNDLKRHLFNLFASWSGPTAKPLGFSHAGYAGTMASGALSGTAGTNLTNSIGIGTTASGTNISLGSIPVEEEKLQFSALQVSFICIFHILFNQLFAIGIVCFCITWSCGLCLTFVYGLGPCSKFKCREKYVAE